jgi:hypothetical protein
MAEVTASTSSVSAPPKPRAPERNRAAEYRAEQEQLQQRAQRQEESRKPEPVVNTQGQTTGRIVNTRA